jgi:hypothetical protein
MFNEEKSTLFKIIASVWNDQKSFAFFDPRHPELTPVPTVKRMGIAKDLAV